MTKIILAAAAAAAPTYDYAILRASKSVPAGSGSTPIVVGIITATVEITAADVGAEQSTRPERARVVAWFVKEGRCAGINVRATPCSGVKRAAGPNWGGSREHGEI